jgi:hypothetical protein
MQSTGRYFSHCNLATPSALGSDPALARKLWEATERIAGGL